MADPPPYKSSDLPWNSTALPWKKKPSVDADPDYTDGQPWNDPRLPWQDPANAGEASPGEETLPHFTIIFN